MPGLYSHISRSTGTVLTEAVFNGDHINHVTNKVFQSMDDYSTNLAQMQIQTDPYPAQVESLATSLAGEFERLRFELHRMKGSPTGRYWYHPDGMQSHPVFQQSFTL